MSNYYAGYEKRLCRNRPEAIEKLVPIMKDHLDNFGYEQPIYNTSKPNAPPRWKLVILFDHATRRRCIVLRDERTKELRYIYTDFKAVRTPSTTVS